MFADVSVFSNFDGFSRAMNTVSVHNTKQSIIFMDPSSGTEIQHQQVSGKFKQFGSDTADVSCLILTDVSLSVSHGASFDR